MQKIWFILFFIALEMLIGSFGSAAPKKGPTVAELFNPQAPQGGIFYRVVPAEPPNINPLGYRDLYASYILAYIMPTLLQRNPETYELEPNFAEKYEISKDNNQITFTLREGLVWQDGKPITAEDVLFSFEAVFNPAYGAARMIPYFQGFEKVEAIDPRTVRFIAKEPYFGNLQTAGTMAILPKHIYGDEKKGPKIVREVFGAGPYMLDKWDVGQKITLKRNPNYFGYKDPNRKGLFNFDKLVFRIVKEDTIRLQMLKKGDIDFIGPAETTPELYQHLAVGPEWGTKVFKQKVENKTPKSYYFIGWNFKNELFQDKNVRIALTHLMNRELMMEKFRYGLSVPGRGPWYYQSEYASPDVKAIPFDPKKAGELLKKAGWQDSNKDGILDKQLNGQRRDFRFTLVYANKDYEKYWTTYKEDLAKAGIRMELQLLEWNAFQKLIQERNFDAIAMGFAAGSVDLNPKQIWHSKSAELTGSNYISYNNPKADQLMDEAVQVLDKPKRIKLYRDIFKLIAADAPCIFIWNPKYELYLHTARVGMVRKTYPYSLGDEGWWIIP